MRPWLFVALWAIACQAIGQVTVLVDTARAVQPWPPYETYSFPRIRLPQHPAVAARIASR